MCRKHNNSNIKSQQWVSRLQFMVQSSKTVVIKFRERGSKIERLVGVLNFSKSLDIHIKFSRPWTDEANIIFFPCITASLISTTRSSSAPERPLFLALSSCSFLRPQAPSLNLGRPQLVLSPFSFRPPPPPESMSIPLRCGLSSSGLHILDQTMMLRLVVLGGGFLIKENVRI
jgi:hypothetical protein